MNCSPFSVRRYCIPTTSTRCALSIIPSTSAFTWANGRKRCSLVKGRSRRSDCTSKSKGRQLTLEAYTTADIHFISFRTFQLSSPTAPRGGLATIQSGQAVGVSGAAVPVRHRSPDGCRADAATDPRASWRRHRTGHKGRQGPFDAAGRRDEGERRFSRIVRRGEKSSSVLGAKLAIDPCFRGFRV